MGPAELSGLQSWGALLGLSMRCKVISGAKTSICLGLSDDIFSSYLGQILLKIILNWIIHPPADSLLQNLQVCCTET